MNAKEALNAMCERCHKEKQAQPSKGDFPHRECPFRHISNDYCEEYETVRKALERQEEILKAIKRNAELSEKTVFMESEEFGPWECRVKEISMKIDSEQAVSDYETIKNWLEEERK